MNLEILMSKHWGLNGSPVIRLIDLNFLWSLGACKCQSCVRNRTRNADDKSCGAYGVSSGLQASPSKHSGYSVRMENAVPIVTQAPGGQPLQIQPGLLTQVQTLPPSPWQWRTMHAKLIIPLCVSWMHCYRRMWLWKRAISMTHFVLMNYNSPPLTKSFSFGHIL